MNKVSCKLCPLHSSVPGVEINSQGICSFCSAKDESETYEKKLVPILINRMEALFEKERKKKNIYDAVVLFSGGKDSTCLLKLAKEVYRLKVLAVSVIHPMVSDIAANNMEMVAKKLDIDLIKFQVKDSIYKKAIRQGILYADDYGLDEFFGCSICCFFHFWIPIRIAIQLNVPIVLEGSDIVQIGHPFYWDSDETKKNIKKGKAPFGTIHRLINDVSTGSSNIYGYDPEIILKCNYPTVISPYTFIDYDFRNAYKEVDHLQLDRKKFNKIYTNCSLIPFLSYFTLKKYGCVPYIKQYASEIRRKRPNLAQMNMYQNAQAESFSKLEIERMLEQYEVVINYVVGNRLTKDQIMNDQREQLKRLAPAFSEMFSVETVEKLLQDLSMIPYYMEYFEVSSDI